MSRATIKTWKKLGLQYGVLFALILLISAYVNEYQWHRLIDNIFVKYSYDISLFVRMVIVFFIS